jgi:glycosyltransferase involved in cell wall biosynthesis
MKNFIKYIQAINENPIVPKEAKSTTTILLPELDTTEGIYRSILPSFILNGSADLRVIIAGITEKTTESNNAKDFTISAEIINESDHIVFPFVTYPLQSIMEKILSVKKGIKFSYYIDFNYYTVPDAYPHAKEYNSAEMIRNIELNIRAVDQVIFTNRSLRDYVQEKLAEKYKQKSGVQLAYQPLFILPEIMEGGYGTNPEPDTLKILMIGDEYQFSDFNWIKGILKDLKTKYKSRIKLIVIGFDGNRKGKNFLAGLEFDYQPRVKFSHYFELIKHISPDILLIPANVSTFNHTTKNYIKYLEFAHLSIPVLAPDIKPYQELITTNKNGFLCGSKDDYFMQVETIFQAREKFEGVMGPAYATASDYSILHENNINILRQIYFPGYVTK